MANMMRRTVVMVDGANLYATSKALGLIVDYRKLLSYFNSSQDLLRAYYFTALIERNDGEHDPLRTTLDYMSYNGWQVITKVAKQYTSEFTGVTKTKGNMDIDMACLAMKLIPSMDQFVLVSGDGDFCPLVRHLQDEGVHVTVVSSYQTNPSMIADELRRQCDVFIDLKEIAGSVRRVAA